MPHSSPAWQATTLGSSLNSVSYFFLSTFNISESGLGVHPGYSPPNLTSQRASSKVDLKALARSIFAESTEDLVRQLMRIAPSFTSTRAILFEVSTKLGIVALMA